MVYRTVGAAELESIVQNGAFTLGAGNEVKYFFTTLAQATKLGSAYEGMGLGAQTIVSGQIPTSALVAAQSTALGGWEAGAIVLRGDDILTLISNLLRH